MKETTEIKKECITYKTKVKCDRCKRYLKEYEGYLEIDYTFGYGTVNDGNNIKAEICEDCILKILRNSDVEYRIKEGKIW